jgi:hypothetical protein
MKQLSAFLLVLSITLRVEAQNTCPLTNAKLVDLRSAASKLAKNITLSAECKSYEDTVNQANAQLKNIATQIADADGKLNPEERPDFKDTAAKAVAQLDTISTLFKDQRCGSELVGFLDYASVFVDVATSMTPFLAMYGGPAAMPWVLGPAIGGAAAKALITFFKNKSVNMRNPDQSNNFLKNSCAFYNLNQIKESLDDLELRQSPAIENALRETKQKLTYHVAAAPPEPNSKAITALKQAEKDLARIKSLQDQMKLDAFEGCSYIKAFAAKEDPHTGRGGLVDRVWANYEKSLTDQPFRLDLERSFFLDDLNPAVASAIDSAKCSRWLTKMHTIAETGIIEVKKAVTEDNVTKNFSRWQEEKTKLEENIKLQEARMKFFAELTGSGFNIEYSEIIRSHQQVQDSLFESYRWLITLKMKGLSEEWLRVKREDADIDMDAFTERRKEIESLMKSTESKIGKKFSRQNVLAFSADYYKKNKREHPEVHGGLLTDVCNQLRRTWTSWYNGLIHAKAGKDYCMAFDRVINQMDYPEVQRLCFGTTTRNGKKKIHSLKNQVVEFNNRKIEADSIIAQMKELSCKESPDMTAELLAKPI